MAKLRKRGSIYYAWIPKPGGGFRLVSTGCTDAVAARTVQIRLEREASDPVSAAQSKALTRDLLSDILASLKRKGRSQATYRFNEQKAGNLVALLPERAAEINHRVLERFVDVRIGEGAAKLTVAKELGVLRAALNLARRNGLFEADPRAILPDIDAEYVPRTRSLDPWELVALCASLEPGKAARVAWLVATGARLGESDRARREDVREGGAYWYLRGTKTKASERTVPVPSPYRPLLTWALDRADGDGRLFAPWTGIGNELRRLCVRLGIPHVSPNDLRRTHGTWLRDMGVEPQLIASQLGHTTSAMAEKVYARLGHVSLGKLLESRVAPVSLMSCEIGAEGGLAVTGESSGTAESSGKVVGQDRLELSANGLRDPSQASDSSENRSSLSGAVSLMSSTGYPSRREQLLSMLGAELSPEQFALAVLQLAVLQP